MRRSGARPLTLLCGALLASGCSIVAGLSEYRIADAAAADGGDIDGGPTDGAVDGGDVDAGSTDAGDAGPVDGGVDLESSASDCSDGVDNDGDDVIDCEDPGCCASGACAVGMAACDCPALSARTAVSVSGEVADGTVWTCDEVYTLNDHVTVPSGTLTIRPGTVVLANPGAALLVERGARLSAVGTAARPIQLTSAQPVGSRAPGDWIGVYLFGSAPMNDPSGEGGVPGLAPLYGGADAAYDCGHLEYVQVSFAGQGGNVNLGLMGCGSDTRVSHVADTRSLDTGFFVAGGTVALDHIVSWGSLDEGFLWSEGWTGSMQYAYIADAGGPLIRGRTSFFDATRTPVSAPNLWNVTLINADPTGEVAIDLLSGSGMHMGNSLLTHMPQACLQVADDAEGQIPGNLSVRNTLFWDCNGTEYFTAGAELDFLESTWANVFTDPLLGGVPVPPTASAAGSGATTAPAGLDTTSYLGAFEPGSTAWYDDWADFSAE